MSDEKHLIEKAIQGNISAFEELINKYDKQVLTLALRYLSDPDEAKDVYQEVFIRVYKSLKKFKFRSSFSTWLYRITINVCLTAKSKNKVKNQFQNLYETNEDGEFINDITVDDDSPYDYSVSNNYNELILEAMEQLSPKQKMCFQLKHYEGYKIKEIAELMDCKEGTIKKYLFDGAGKLRILLKDLCDA